MRKARGWADVDGERVVTETDGNSDAGLVAAIRERQDVSAFAGLVHRHQDVAVQVAFSVLGEAALAEDAAQKAFIYAYTHLGALFANRSRSRAGFAASS